MQKYIIYNANGMPKLGQFLYKINKYTEDLNSGDAFRVELTDKQLRTVIAFLQKFDADDNAYILSDKNRTLVYDPMREGDKVAETKSVKMIESIVRKVLHRSKVNKK